MSLSVTPLCPRLLGVDRVVIYNTSCSSDVDRLLRSYIQEGFLEVVPWPIDQHLTPSPGWLFSSSGGDLHYFGQLTTLNECVYRSMERSRYVLLNDIDEIIMPYEHKDLPSLMDTLQRDNPNVTYISVNIHIEGSYLHIHAHLSVFRTSPFSRRRSFLLKTTYFPRHNLSQVGSSTCLSGTTCRELIFWSTSTGRSPTERYITRTR